MWQKNCQCPLNYFFLILRKTTWSETSENIWKSILKFSRDCGYHNITITVLPEHYQKHKQYRFTTSLIYFTVIITNQVTFSRKQEVVLKRTVLSWWRRSSGRGGGIADRLGNALAMLQSCENEYELIAYFTIQNFRNAQV